MIYNHVQDCWNYNEASKRRHTQGAFVLSIATLVYLAASQVCDGQPSAIPESCQVWSALICLWCYAWHPLHISAISGGKEPCNDTFPCLNENKAPNGGLKNHFTLLMFTTGI